MNVLILGSGGREHAFAWKLAQSKNIQRLFVAPGNAGTASVAENISIDPCDFESVKSFVLSHAIELVLVGPEAPLVAGIVDYFQHDAELSQIAIIGPSKAGALLEGSKDFAKSFMIKNQIPTARYATFTKSNLNEGIAFLRSLKAPYVLKADGLAAGKGVIIPDNLPDAEQALEQLLGGQFGEASSKVVIEEFLPGIEMSAFVLTDGETYVMLPEAKDYKRIGEGDTGLNTGGMGAVSPVPFCSTALMEKIHTRIAKPTVDGLKKEGIHYVGFIFIGLMIVEHEPFVIEYNCRMGDPETEVVIPRIENDLLEVLRATAERRLHSISIQSDPRFAVTTMLVSGGYPEEFEKGKVIGEIANMDNTITFHAGTKMNGNYVVTNGGRVMAVTAMDKTMSRAIAQSQEIASRVVFEGKYFRTDIGRDLLGFV